MTTNEMFSFIGPEGSGKTTQAARLAKEVDKPFFTTSDLLHDLAKNDPGPLGDACRNMFETHTYLPGDQFLQIIAQRLSKPDIESGVVVDGSLRTYEETVGYPAMLESIDRQMPMTVIYLNIPEEVSYERLVTGEHARKRDHDSIEGVAGRLAEFHNRLEERLEFIVNQKDWRLLEVDASLSPDEVFQSICEVLGIEKAY